MVFLPCRKHPEGSESAVLIRRLAASAHDAGKEKPDQKAGFEVFSDDRNAQAPSTLMRELRREIFRDAVLRW